MIRKRLTVLVVGALITCVGGGLLARDVPSDCDEQWHEACVKKTSECVDCPAWCEKTFGNRCIMEWDYCESWVDPDDERSCEPDAPIRTECTCKPKPPDGGGGPL
jgi:hypothetical protein